MPWCIPLTISHQNSMNSFAVKRTKTMIPAIFYMVWQLGCSDLIARDCFSVKRYLPLNSNCVPKIIVKWPTVVCIRQVSPSPSNSEMTNSTHWGQVRPRSGSTLAQVMPCTKPLPEPMLTFHHQGLVAFIWGKFHKKDLSHRSLNSAWKLPT